MTPKLTRRKFLSTAALAIGMPTIIPASALGKNGTVAPSNRIVMGGIGPRGRLVLSCFLKQPDVQFVAIADVHESRREIVRRITNKHYGNEDCYKCRDMAEILGRDDIDAVQITTGDRWHALATILASRAGKDVYAKKPYSMTIHETQELADAVATHKRVFQAGTQRRNVDHFRFAADLARSGRLGKIHTVHASILKLVRDLAALPGEPEPTPALIDWDRWVGPAPLCPYNKRYVEGQWAAGTDGTSPVEFQIQGDQIHGRYANGVKLVLRLSGFKGEGDWVAPGTCPVRFEGEEGWVETADFGKIATSKPSLLAGQPTTEMSGTDPIKHVREFIDAIKSRSSTAANAEVTRHGYIACHAAAIGWQLARTVNFDPANGKFINDDEANRMCSSPRRAPYPSDPPQPHRRSHRRASFK
jgi:hypothetical protein